MGRAAHSSSSSIDSSSHPDLLLPVPAGSSSSSSLSQKINGNYGNSHINTRTDLSTDLRLGLSISPSHHSDLSSTSTPGYANITFIEPTNVQIILLYFFKNKKKGNYSWVFPKICSWSTFVVVTWYVCFDSKLTFQGGSTDKLATNQIYLEEQTCRKSRPSLLICEGLHGRHSNW